MPMDGVCGGIQAFEGVGASRKTEFNVKILSLDLSYLNRW
jgi:hypothetical protein